MSFNNIKDLIFSFYYVKYEISSWDTLSDEEIILNQLCNNKLINDIKNYPLPDNHPYKFLDIIGRYPQIRIRY